MAHSIWPEAALGESNDGCFSEIDIARLGVPLGGVGGAGKLVFATAASTGDGNLFPSKSSPIAGWTVVAVGWIKGWVTGI